MTDSLTYQQTDTPARGQVHALFAQTMGYVAATAGLFALGAWLGRNLTGGVGIVAFIAAFAALIAMRAAARRSTELTIGLLAAFGLLIGLAVAPTVAYYGSMDPRALWQAGGAIALFIAGFGAAGYATRRDLTAIVRVSFWALVALIVFGIVLIFVHIPGGALVNALKVTDTRWRDQRVVLLGGGTAGVGIADQIRAQMVRDGLNEAQAARQIWIVDLPGLLTDDMGDGLLDYQRPYARPAAEAAGWAKTPAQIDPSTLQRWPQMATLRQARAASGIITLETVVGQVKPTVLIGASTAHGAFTRQIVETMSAGVEQPVIFPVSNPTSQIEATPADIIGWSRGKALVATGLPIPPVDYAGVRYWIGQANNALLYPGLGLGTIVSGASKVTDGMLRAAAEAVAGQADVSAPGASLLPAVENLRASSATAAVAVARAAADDGVATEKHDNLVQAVQDAIWQPAYPDSVS